MVQTNNTDLIDALADYFVMRGAPETKLEMIGKLAAMSEEQLKYFADLTMKDVAQRATGLQHVGMPQRRQ